MKTYKKNLIVIGMVVLCFTLSRIVEEITGYNADFFFGMIYALITLDLLITIDRNYVN